MTDASSTNDSTADNFTDEELFAMTALPSMVGSVISFSDASGPIGTVKEMMANAKTAAAGVKNYPDNSILRRVIPNVEDRAEAMETAKAMRDRQMEELKTAGIKSKDDMKAHALAKAAEINDVLNAKASATEAAEYRSWVMDAARATAEAAKEGGFLGLGGVDVSGDEQAALDEIADALGVAR